MDVMTGWAKSLVLDDETGRQGWWTDGTSVTRSALRAPW